MIIPHWSTIGLFVALVTQVVLAWLQIRKTGKGFREVVLPNALAAGAVSIIFAREFFGDLPAWVDVPITILCLLLMVMAIGMWVVQFRRYLKEAWRLEGK